MIGSSRSVHQTRCLHLALFCAAWQGCAPTARASAALASRVLSTACSVCPARTCAPCGKHHKGVCCGVAPTSISLQVLPRAQPFAYSALKSPGWFTVWLLCAVPGMASQRFTSQARLAAGQATGPGQHAGCCCLRSRAGEHKVAASAVVAQCIFASWPANPTPASTLGARLWMPEATNLMQAAEVTCASRGKQRRPSRL